MSPDPGHNGSIVRKYEKKADFLGVESWQFSQSVLDDTVWVTELLCFKQEPITTGTDYWKGSVGRLSAESLKVIICTTLS